MNGRNPIALASATGSSPDRQGVMTLLAATSVVALAYLIFLIFRPFATALVFAVVMCVVFYPLHQRTSAHLPRDASAAASTTIVVLVIIVPSWLIATRLVTETMDLAGNIRTISFEALFAQAQAHASRLGIELEPLLLAGAQHVAGQAGALASHVVQDAWSLIIGIALAVLAMFFLFRDGAYLVDLLTRALPMPVPMSRSMVHEAGLMISSNLTASLVAAAIQGTLGGLAFAWIGLPAPLLWGVVMGVFSVFPVIGAWLVWAPAAAALAIGGRLTDAVLLIVIGFCVVHPVDNMLRPAMVSRVTKLNGLLVLIGLLGGVRAFGASGLLLGPVFVSVAAGLVEAAAARTR